MNLIFQLLLLCLCFIMFFIKRKYKVALLFFATICLDSITVTFIPFGGAIYLLSISFLLSELPKFSRDIRYLNKTIIYFLLLVQIIATVTLIITSPHYNNSILQYTKIFIFELFTKYFILGYAFLSIKKEQDLTPMIRISFCGLLILTFIGVVNLLTMHAAFIDLAYEGRTGLNDVMENLGSKFIDSDRFRVQAMFFNPFNYGYICIMLLCFNTYVFLKGLLSKTLFYIAIVCCLFGIVFCGCRTVILCTVIGCITFLLMNFTLARSVRVGIVFFLIGVIAYSNIPAVQKGIDAVTTVFDKNATYGGSSIEMRTLQFARVFYYIQGHKLFGRGKDFFNIDLGWKDGLTGSLDKDLWGLESILMSTLLERGYIGLLFYIVFYGTLLYVAFRFRKQDRLTSSMCFSVLMVYLSFANMTGELSSAFSTLLLVGCFFGILYSYRIKN